MLLLLSIKCQQRKEKTLPKVSPSKNSTTVQMLTNLNAFIPFILPTIADKPQPFQVLTIIPD